MANRDKLGKFLEGFHASPLTEFKNGYHASASTEFGKGHVPWIKGRHHNKETKRRCSIASIGNNHALINPNLEMSDTLAYLLGVIYGDGYFTFRKDTWCVGLRVSKPEFAKCFREALIDIGLRPSKVALQLEFVEGQVYQRYRVEAYSKVFHNFYSELSLNELKKKLLAGYDLGWAFLRGLYESEGTRFYDRKLKKVVVVYNTNYKLIELSEAVLDYLGFAHSISGRKPYGNRKPYYQLYLRGSSERKEEFLVLLNPCIKKVEKAEMAELLL